MRFENSPEIINIFSRQIINISTDDNDIELTHHSETNTESSDHQQPGRSQEGECKLPTEKSVKKSTRCDGSRHSVLETLGQTQSGGEDGDGVGCEKFSLSNSSAGSETKYLGEEAGVLVEENVVDTIFGI